MLVKLVPLEYRKAQDIFGHPPNRTFFSYYDASLFYFKACSWAVSETVHKTFTNFHEDFGYFFIKYSRLRIGERFIIFLRLIAWVAVLTTRETNADTPIEFESSIPVHHKKTLT